MNKNCGSVSCSACATTVFKRRLSPAKCMSLLPDKDAGKHKMLRIVDESGEDYLYPAEFFAPIAISKSLAQILEKSA